MITLVTNLIVYIQETRRLVDKAYVRAKQLLQNNLLKLEKVKESLARDSLKYLSISLNYKFTIYMF